MLLAFHFALNLRLTFSLLSERSQHDVNLKWRALVLPTFKTSLGASLEQVPFLSWSPHHPNAKNNAGDIIGAHKYLSN